MSVKMSEKGRKLLEEWEGCRLRVYKDSAGLYTIGYGHLLTKPEIYTGTIQISGLPVKYEKGLTKEQADDLLEQDLVLPEITVTPFVKDLNQDQTDALISFVFNVGSAAFKTSALAGKLLDKKLEDVPRQLRRWIYAGGKKINGLIKRREKEIKLWNGEL